MNTLNKPELSLLHTGSSLKTLQVSALAGMVMPLHHATKETVIVVQEGTATLKMPTVEHVLERSVAIIIQDVVNHCFGIQTEFKDNHIMAADSDNECQKQ